MYDSNPLARVEYHKSEIWRVVWNAYFQYFICNKNGQDNIVSLVQKKILYSKVRHSGIS